MTRINQSKMDLMQYYGMTPAIPDIDPDNFEQVRDALLSAAAADGRVAGSPKYEDYKPPEIDLNPDFSRRMAAFCIDERMAA